MHNYIKVKRISIRTENRRKKEKMVQKDGEMSQSYWQRTREIILQSKRICRLPFEDRIKHVKQNKTNLKILAC